MNENDTPLIGTPVSLTVFVVDYVYTKPPRKAKLPKSAGKAKDSEKVANTVVVTTGDPTGQDIFLIAKRLVLGPNPYEESDFKLLKVQRAFEAAGLAQVTSWEKISGSASENGNLITEESEGGEGDGSDNSGSIPPGADLN